MAANHDPLDRALTIIVGSIIVSTLIIFFGGTLIWCLILMGVLPPP